MEAVALTLELTVAVVVVSMAGQKFLNLTALTTKISLTSQESLEVLNCNKPTTMNTAMLF